MNGGRCNLVDVTVACDDVTRGVVVRPFATCKGPVVRIKSRDSLHNSHDCSKKNSSLVLVQ